jgi:PAS domain S-box-containing protein
VKREISFRERVEESLSRNREILPALLGNLRAMVYRCKNDKNWTMEFVSAPCFELTGYKPDDLVNNKLISYSDLIVEEDRGYVRQTVLKSLSNNKPFEIIYRIKTKSGEIKNVWELGHAVVDREKDDLFLEGLILDVAHQANTTNDLEQSEAKFRSLVEKSLVGVYVIQDNKFVYVNPTFAEYFGYTPEEIVSVVKVRDLVYDEDRQKVLDNIQKRINNEVESLRYTFRGKRKDGSLFIVEVLGTKTIYRGKNAIVGSIMDITKRIEFEKSIKENEERFSSLFKNMPDASVILDWDGTILFANNAAADLVELKTVKEGIGRNIFEFVSEDYRQLVKNDLLKIKNNENGPVSEYKIHTIYGKEKWVEAVGAKIKYSSKEVDLVSLRDVSERKDADQKIVLLTNALQSVANGTLITDEAGNIVWINEALSKLTGYVSEEVIGKNTRIFSSRKMPVTFYTNLWNTVLSGRVWRGELINRKKDGSLYPEEMTITPVKLPGSSSNYYVAVKQDISERKKFELELKGAKEKAEDLNRLKSIFLSNMSHELRTPLVGILGFAELLSDELDDSALKEMSESILSSGKRLMETLNYVLDLSKVESNKLEIIYKEVNVPFLLKEVVKSFQPMAYKKGLYLRLLVEDENCTIRIDDQMFRGIINNLLNNAVKFTRSGGVSVEVYKKHNQLRSYVVISIRDTGIGIPEDKLKIIFEEFRQISEGFDRKYEGSGLGLTITKRFVEALNGTISVKSKAGSGSVFSVSLPENRISPVEKRPIPVTSGNIEPLLSDADTKHDFNLLLVENDQASIDVTTIFLKDIGNIDIAKDGITAMRKAEENNYDAIIMDIDLGWGMNGIEVTQELRKIDKYKSVPIIALTAYAMNGDREKFIDAGCSYYLSKPFDKKSLIETIGKALSIKVN